MPIQKIGKMELKNNGGFVARIQIKYVQNGHNHYSDISGDITLGFSKTVHLADLKVPDGAMVYMKAIVVGGYDHEATKQFIFQKNDNTVARYVISGTTLHNELGLADIV